jgi:hypothetical protein
MNDADMWVSGVYILLGGYPPLSDNEICFAKSARVTEFHEEYWGTVSTEAKELISSLLTVKCEPVDGIGRHGEFVDSR